MWPSGADEVSVMITNMTARGFGVAVQRSRCSAEQTGERVRQKGGTKASQSWKILVFAICPLRCLVGVCTHPVEATAARNIRQRGVSINETA